MGSTYQLFPLGCKISEAFGLIQITSGMKRSRCCTHSAHIQTPAAAHTHTDSWPRDTNTRPQSPTPTQTQTHTHTHTRRKGRGAATSDFPLYLIKNTFRLFRWAAP